jgi:hypothetical protein
LLTDVEIETITRVLTSPHKTPVVHARVIVNLTNVLLTPISDDRSVLSTAATGPSGSQGPLIISDPLLVDKDPLHYQALKPVFGVSLEDLYARDGCATPYLLQMCFRAVEMFGLDVEGLYRVSGNAGHISNMKAVFDRGELD